MTTTNLIVDFLVIGGSAAIWILPLILFQPAGMVWIKGLTKFEVGTALFILPLIYALGIAISRFADLITSIIDGQIKKKHFKNTNYHKLLNYIIARFETTPDYFDYRRSIIRISRGSFPNFLAGGVIWFLYAQYKSNNSPSLPNYWIAAICVVIAILLIWTWIEVLGGYFATIADIYQRLHDKESKSECDEHQSPA